MLDLNVYGALLCARAAARWMSISILFLLADAASYVTGAVLRVAGGR